MEQPPDRWIGCPPHGDVIEDTFLPMKTFLDENISVPPDQQFNSDILMRKYPNVGLIINLTFSRRYYDSEDIKVAYKQISCRGHNQAPQPREIAEFTKVCTSFLATNPTKIIAVHCTHGFNRTGFMICSYLCSQRDWAFDAAIKLFASKRPPGIYKQDYLGELHNLYADSDDPVPKAPPKPMWDSNSSPSIDQQQTQQEFYPGITGVVLVRDALLRDKIYQHCCQLVEFNGANTVFPGAQPVSMDRENIELLKEHRYRVSWKADGCRYMMYIQDEDNIFFLNRNLQLWRVIGMRFPKLEDLHSQVSDTLVDGEMVTDNENGQNVPRYLIYDVISYDGKNVRRENFDKRCGIIKCKLIEARNKAKLANIYQAESEPFKVMDKGFFYLKYTKKTLDLKVLHEKDGLIFQPFKDFYQGGTCHKILKWKPPSLNSIDFRLVIREEIQNGCIPETYVYLHVNNKRDPIVRFKVDRKTQSYYEQYNNKIVEMTLNAGRWEVMRERTDKLTANSFETAVATFKSIKNPVTEDFLKGFVDSLPEHLKK